MDLTTGPVAVLLMNTGHQFNSDVTQKLQRHSLQAVVQGDVCSIQSHCDILQDNAPSHTSKYYPGTN